MAKRRPSGDGMVRKRDDGRWEGRIVVGHKENGDSIFRYIYADNQKELTANRELPVDVSLPCQRGLSQRPNRSSQKATDRFETGRM